MRILADNLLESLAYFVEYLDKLRAAEVKKKPGLLGYLSEVVCQVFDDTGLSDALEASTDVDYVARQLGSPASESLHKLSQAIDAWDVNGPDDSEISHAYELTSAALRAMRDSPNE